MNGIKFVQAIDLASKAHRGQTRSGGQCYLTHPISVAKLLVDTWPDSRDELILAAILHDVVEDTCVPWAYISELFGSEVAEIVDQLTNKYSDKLPHNEKVVAVREHVNRMSPDAKRIKLCDRYDNIMDLSGWEPRRINRYAHQTHDMLINTKWPDGSMYLYHQIIDKCFYLKRQYEGFPL